MLDKFERISKAVDEIKAALAHEKLRRGKSDHASSVLLFERAVKEFEDAVEEYEATNA